MDLTTNYLGFELKNPLVASASPLSESLDNLKRMEDAGIAAVVNYSLFEEEIIRESHQLHDYLVQGTESFAESLSYFPEPEIFTLTPEEYFEHIRRAKEALDIPVIGSLNGYSEGGWAKYAALIQDAGADALELNLYAVATDPAKSAEEVEQIYLNILEAVRSSVSIPVAVKLSPYFTSLAHMARRLDLAGAEGLVLFNRFYQPDFDLARLEVFPNLLLSTGNASRLPLRWIAILYGRVKADLAATSGIYDSEDVLKMLMAGASATMLCAAILKHGFSRITEILDGLRRWMEENEYESVRQMQGSMSQRSCPDPAAFERVNYLKALRGYRIH